MSKRLQDCQITYEKEERPGGPIGWACSTCDRWTCGSTATKWYNAWNKARYSCAICTQVWALGHHPGIAPAGAIIPGHVLGGAAPGGKAPPPFIAAPVVPPAVLPVAAPFVPPVAAKAAPFVVPPAVLPPAVQTVVAALGTIPSSSSSSSSSAPFVPLEGTNIPVPQDSDSDMSVENMRMNVENMELD